MSDCRTINIQKKARARQRRAIVNQELLTPTSIFIISMIVLYFLNK